MGNSGSRKLCAVGGDLHASFAHRRRFASAAVCGSCCKYRWIGVAGGLVRHVPL
jgi:hypothetical protein